ncbi:Oidioi.mRNA.OKI2018_I69.XSR.g15915.t1.cds [Oikopleura dioica]|uniref:Oidioi.mRNA.OKI2018_I69.XSR.g15915.t1.cds n=1 Tax=Oikopleura dioica TaxID=34765 RepID=A0ABN7SJG5_OIKDI|nr:Oidioi.mRNA.OKI2018_I69.XSR.g15915.t1.cds [Oikopleura dioica]
MLKLASRLSRCVLLRNQHAFVQGYSSFNTTASWCDNSSDQDSNEVQDLIFKVDEIETEAKPVLACVSDLMKTSKVEYLESNLPIQLRMGVDFETNKDKIKKRFNKFQIRHVIDMDNGGRNARIIVVCDPSETAAALEFGALLAGSSKMMLDFVYEKPEVDYCFCLENQFEVFRRNDTFKTTLQKMAVDIPVVLNEKKGKFNEYVINDLDVIQKFNKPLLCGSKEDFGVVVGDMSMSEEKLIENIQIVTDKLSKLFGFAMTKQGKSADKDRLFLKNARLQVAGLEDFNIECADNKPELIF